MTLYLTERLGYSISQAATVFAIFGLGAVCGGFIGGLAANRFGFYRVQLVTLACGGVLFMLLGQMRSYPLICVFTFILSVVNESFRPANSLAIAHYSKEENRTRSYSLNRLAINLGWALGGSIGGFLAAHNYSLLFIVDGFTNIGAAILLRIFLAPAKQVKYASRQNAVKAPWYEVYKDLRYMAFAIFVLLYALAFFQLFSTLPVYYRKVLQLSEEVIGATMAGNGILIALFEMVIVFRLEGKRTPLQYIPIGTFMVAASFIIFNLMTGGIAVAVLSTLIVTFGEILSMPFMNTYWLSRTNDSNRGQYAGMYTVAWAGAQVLGPYYGGKIADWAGFTRLWWLIGIIAIISATGFWLLHLKDNSRHLSARTE